ncbi:MAG: cytochrome c biogenesis protein CcdA [Marmoricola sp.]
MLEASAAVALGAGMLAALNPCGFAMLPAYLTLMVTAGEPTRVVAVYRALKMTLAMTAGFTLVFAVFGLAIAPVASSAQQYLPWFTLVVGLVLAGAGGWLLAGRSLPALRARGGGGAPLTGSVRSMFGFGVSYALASLTCTVAPFLAVVVSAFRSDSVLTGAALFLLYAAGMGLVVGTAAVAVALAQQSLVRGARRLGAHVSRAGGLLLLLVGGYVAYYGWWEIRVFAGGSAEDPVIEAAASVQRSLSTAVTDFGAVGFLVTLAALITLVVGSSAARGRRRRRHEAGLPDGPAAPAQPEVPGRPGDVGRSQPSP